MLRSYQQQAIDAIPESGRYLIHLATGLGKTYLASQIPRRGRLLWLSHREELVWQPKECFKGCSYGVEQAKLKSNGEEIVSASVQSIVKRLPKFKPDDFDIIIIDECFPAGTKIDNKNIENCKIGDIVSSYNHKKNKIEQKKIINVFKHNCNELVIINLSNKEKLICTKNHPVFTKNGYIEASKLTNNHELYLLRERNNQRINKKSTVFLQKEQSGILFRRLYKKILRYSVCKKYDSNKQKICVGKNEEKKSYAQSRNKTENVEKTKRDRTLSKNKMWEWHGANCSATKLINSYKKFRTLCRISSPHERSKRFWLSFLLQIRYSIAAIFNRNRSRWELPFFFRKKSSRQEKRTFFEWSRVENIEIQKRESYRGFGKLCPDNYVYNIEVEDNNNYFANGILVHNCHRSSAKTYLSIVNHFTPRLLIGLTATPNRSDGEGLDKVFDKIIFSRDLKWGIQNSFLSNLECLRVNIGYDISNIRKNIDDFSISELDKAVNENKCNKAIAQAYHQYARGQTIIFACSVDHAINLSREIAGSRYISGKSKDRTEIIQAFRNKEFSCLINCQILVEGVNIPEIETIIMARPTQSTVFYVQAVGRELRLYKPLDILLEKYKQYLQ